MTAHIIGLHIRNPDKTRPSMPKAPVETVEVLPTGLVGDFNVFRHRKLKDTPDMAIMLWPDEERVQLNQEGWPVQPGDIGENVLTSGLPPEIWQDGTRLRLGSEVEVELSERCEPCNNLAILPYVGKKGQTSFLKATTGRRGYYGRVLRAGSVKVGDSIEVQWVPGATPAEGSSSS